MIAETVLHSLPFEAAYGFVLALCLIGAVIVSGKIIDLQQRVQESTDLTTQEGIDAVAAAD